MRPVRRRRGARMALVDPTVGMILGVGVRRPAGLACARAGERDQRRYDRAEKRQKDDRVIHASLSPSSG